MTTARTAHADQLAAHLRDHRCDALDPCDTCKADAREVQAARHAARVAAAKPQRMSVQSERMGA